MTADEIIHELPKGLVKWYKFKPESNVLYITAGTDFDAALTEVLSECNLFLYTATVTELGKLTEEHTYDYIMIASAIERTGEIHQAQQLLGKVYSLLKEEGTLFLGMDNRLGIRYFCGDKDGYTERNFDGIENYVRAIGGYGNELQGRGFSKAEIIEMLERNGFFNHKFYSVFPLLQSPQIMFADNYTPNEKLDIRIAPQYNSPDTVFLKEEQLYDTLIENGLFHTMANGFWVECPLNGTFSDANQITMSLNRGKENAMFTIIHQDNTVEKKPVYQEGIPKIKALMDNTTYLNAHGINMVETEFKNDSCFMPYIHAISAVEYLRDLAITDKNLFVKRLDELWNLILTSSEHVSYTDIDWEHFEPGWDKRRVDDPTKNKWKNFAYGTQEEQGNIGVILKRGYIDLVPLNCFWTGDKFLFYDQELYVENLPAKVIMLRIIDNVYSRNPQLDISLPQTKLKKRYSLEACEELFFGFIRQFLNQLRNDDILKFYYKEVRRNDTLVNSNRQRLNYSIEDYERIFRDIFKGAKSRQLYLFGSGKFANRFLSQFGNEYVIQGIIDNNPKKWGTKLEGIDIYSVDILKKLEPGTFKILICIKNYSAVIRQLRGMGITDFSIYDSNLIYPRTHELQASGYPSAEIEKKKYHVGYIAGVFDLFHLGHLNLFKRAKMLCDYLIVGVVTDESVIKDKRTTPMVPFEERIEIVRSCRYVDEAVMIPPDLCGTEEAYRRYQFDVQFSGSDYENDQNWLDKKRFLQKHGSDLVFFPYTESVSSTQRKQQIGEQGESKLSKYN